MNKQELIEKYKNKYPVISMDVKEFRYFIELWEDMKQLDEPQKITIPQVGADWIEWTKKDGLDLQDAMNLISGEENEKLLRWFYDECNQETFARAWLDGYEVEEKRYLVSLRNGQPLVKTPLGKDFYFNQNILAEKYKATRKELEQAGFGWVFDCEGIEIEEAEE